MQPWRQQPWRRLHLVHEPVEIPLVVRRDRAVVRDAIQHVELLHGDRVDFILRERRGGERREEASRQAAGVES